jgi:hypothetical protein
MNTDVNGDVKLGPSGTFSHGSLSITGSQSTVPSGIAAPAPASSTPAINPGGVPAALVVSGTMTLLGGNYYFTSITMGNNDTLQFSGPATVRLNGNASFGNSCTIKAFGSVPGNLTIQVIGAHSIGDTADNNFTLYGTIEGPSATLASKNNFMLYGSALVQTIDVKNDAQFFYDETLGAAGGSSVLSLVR